MISYKEFKKIFDLLNEIIEPEIEIYFNDKKYNYMIIKYGNYITFQRCGPYDIQSGEIKFSNLEELYNTKTIDNIYLKKDWNKISDILIDRTFSVIDDLEEIKRIYKINL